MLLTSKCAGGLQVKPPCFNEWTDVPYVEGAWVVNSGEILTFWTKGQVLATEHRVRMPTKEELPQSDRVSIGFSLLPRGDTELVPFHAQMNYKGSRLGDFLADLVSRYRSK